VAEGELDALAERVLADPALHRRLLAVLERNAFVDETVAVAHELGLDVTAADVVDGLRHALEWWLARWV
jgi:hypothetical protein